MCFILDLICGLNELITYVHKNSSGENINTNFFLIKWIHLDVYDVYELSQRQIGKEFQSNHIESLSTM